MNIPFVRPSGAQENSYEKVELGARFRVFSQIHRRKRKKKKINLIEQRLAGRDEKLLFFSRVFTFLGSVLRAGPLRRSRTAGVR